MTSPRTSASLLAAPRLLIDNEDHSIVSIANVLVQVRRGQMTIDVLDSLLVFARATRVRNGGTLGILSVIEPIAPMPSADVRKRQNELVSMLLSDMNTYQALVLLGDSATASAQRALARMTSHTVDSQLSIHAEIETAVQWLHSLLKTDMQVIRSTVERLRRVVSK